MKTLSLFIARLGLIGGLLICLYGQFVLIPSAGQYAQSGFSRLHVYMSIAILGLVCVEAVLFATWKLIDLVQRRAILTERAFPWIDLILWSTAAAVFLVVAVGAQLLATGRDMGPIRSVDEFDAMLLCVGVGIVFGVLVFVLRGLLHKTVNLKSETAELKSEIAEVI